ncbi:reverse transcriptase [Gossypium australe]|uniref:Reverse transcriptase n=1 Tax=Gossypium australe TaxID=47621 RepID=A0A5B6UYK5_9ROSI|nr:reverse transcriptase [Gossypium australe]
MNTQLSVTDGGLILAKLRAKPMFLQEICEAQKGDKELQAKITQCEAGIESDFQIGSDGCLMFQDRICVPKDDELIQKILHEAHSSCMSIHPGSVKMYKDLKKMYWLTKSAHFRPVSTDYPLVKLANLYVFEIVRLHKIPLSIISDRDPRFTSRFWKKLQEALRTKLNFSTAFHLQTDGQSERVIQILEDMLQCCVLKLQGSWERENQIHGVDLFRETEEKVKVIRDCLKAASNRQKFYADLKWKEIEFQVSDKVFLKVSLWKKVLKFVRKGKLSPLFIGLYEITERIGLVAYHLALPFELERIHDVFHIYMLCHYRSDPLHVIVQTEVEIQPDMTYGKAPVKILDQEVEKLRNKSIALVKVLWQRHGVEQATWEPEEAMRNQYPNLFTGKIFGDKNS